MDNLLIFTIHISQIMAVPPLSIVGLFQPHFAQAKNQEKLPW